MKRTMLLCHAHVRLFLFVAGALGAVLVATGCAPSAAKEFDQLRVGHTVLPKDEDTFFKRGIPTSLRALFISDSSSGDSATMYLVLTSEADEVVAKVAQSAHGERMVTELWATRDVLLDYRDNERRLSETARSWDPGTRIEMSAPLRSGVTDPNAWVLLTIALHGWPFDQPADNLIASVRGEAVAWGELWPRVEAADADCEIRIRDRYPRDAPRPSAE